MGAFMSDVVTETIEKITIIQFNRPQALNALDPPAIQLFQEALLNFREHPQLWVAIITGTGDRGFCTGADLKKTLPPSDSFASAYFLPERQSIEKGMYIRGLDITKLNIDKPIIAAVNGHAVGGGLEIALSCDIRIASENATFGLGEVKVGSIPALGGIQRLIRGIPMSIAMRMLLTGERIDAKEAHRIGLISNVFPLAHLKTEALALAGRICQNGPLAVRAVKRLTQWGLNMPLDQAIGLEQLMWGVLRDTEDRIEGRVAFEQKREPQYKGR
jgi:E-phenylitaconyl-CoA hydratase